MYEPIPPRSGPPAGSADRLRQFSHAAGHRRLGSGQDLRVRLPGAQGHQPGHPPRRDLRPARPQRRRQDDADQHHLRHRQSDVRERARRRPSFHRRLPRRPLADRPRAAGIDHRRVRDRVGDRELQPAPVRQARQFRIHRQGVEGALAVGPERQQDHDALRRHEAPGADRQGAVARAADPVPRRADRRRRRRAAPGHVERGARPAGLGRHHHPDDALHRRGRADGRPRSA